MIWSRAWTGAACGRKKVHPTMPVAHRTSRMRMERFRSIGVIVQILSVVELWAWAEQTMAVQAGADGQCAPVQTLNGHRAVACDWRPACAEPDGSAGLLY